VYAQTAVLGNNKVFLDPHALGICLSELGYVLMRAGDCDRAREHFEQGEQVLLAAEDGHALATLRCRMGLLFSVVKEGASKITAEAAETASEKIAQSLEASEKHGNKIGIALCIEAQGLSWCRRGDQHKGIQKLRLALDMLRELGNKQLQGDCLMNLGEAFLHSPQGVVHLEQCLVVRRSSADLVGEAQCLQALGSLHTYLGNTRAGTKCWQDSLNLKRELMDEAGVKECLQHLCALYTQLEDYSRVSDYVGQLRDIAQAQNDFDAEAQALIMTGRCHFNLGSLPGAEKSFKAALKICEDHSKSEQLLVREAECHDKLATLYLQQHRNPEAKKEQEHVNRIRKKLGKDILRPVVGPSDKGLKRKIFGLGGALGAKAL